jgi:hypothetical protein
MNSWSGSPVLYRGMNCSGWSPTKWQQSGADPLGGALWARIWARPTPWSGSLHAGSFMPYRWPYPSMQGSSAKEQRSTPNRPSPRVPRRPPVLRSGQPRAGCRSALSGRYKRRERAHKNPWLRDFQASSHPTPVMLVINWICTGTLPSCRIFCRSNKYPSGSLGSLPGSRIWFTIRFRIIGVVRLFHQNGSGAALHTA